MSLFYTSFNMIILRTHLLLSFFPWLVLCSTSFGNQDSGRAPPSKVHLISSSATISFAYGTASDASKIALAANGCGTSLPDPKLRRAFAFIVLESLTDHCVQTLHRNSTTGSHNGTSGALCSHKIGTASSSGNIPPGTGISGGVYRNHTVSDPLPRLLVMKSSRMTDIPP